MTKIVYKILCGTYDLMHVHFEKRPEIEELAQFMFSLCVNFRLHVVQRSSMPIRMTQNI